MEIGASSGEVGNQEQGTTKYNLRSHDLKADHMKNKEEEIETVPRRIRTRSQCSNASDLEESVSSPSRKTAKTILGQNSRTSKKTDYVKSAQNLKEKQENSSNRRRTRSQCSVSDLEEIEVDAGNTSHKKVSGKLYQDLHIETAIPEEKLLSTDNIADDSSKKTAIKKGRKRLKETGNEAGDDPVNEKEKKTEEGKGSGKKRKAAKSSLIVQLELFSKFKNPRAIFIEPQLRELYFDLLVHKNADVQKVAFQCIMSYKYKYLTAYEENFNRLLEDRSFKDEIVLFSIDHENSVISLEHRSDVLKVLMRILYGKMHVKTGKGTGGKQYSGVRQSIVLRFLNGCKQNELETFVNLVFAPFQHFITEDPNKMVLNLWENVDLTKVLPVKKLQGVLNSVDVIFKKLGHLLDGYLPKLIQIIVGMATVCGVCLENRKKIIPQVINPLKTIRQLTIYRLLHIFKDYDKYDWKRSEVDAVFAAVVWPQLEKLPYEGLYHPTPLLKLFHCWSKHPRYFRLLAKHKETSAMVTPLPYIIKLLQSKDASVSVRTCIMDIIDNLLLPLETYFLDEVKVVEVSHMIKLMATDTVQGKLKLNLYHCLGYFSA